jgi:putative DNA primase/helicase
LLENPEPAPIPRPETPREREKTHKWAEAALSDELRTLAGAAQGTRNDQLNRSAFSLGQIVGGGYLSQHEVETALYNACITNGLVSDDGEKGVLATINSGLKAGLQSPRHPQKRDAVNVATIAPQRGETRGGAVLSRSISLSTVQRTLNLGETGDGELLATIYKDQLVYDHAEKNWYLWNGHTWEKDTTAKAPDLVAYQVAAQYLQAAADLQAAGEEQLATAMTKRASSLRQRSRINNVLERAKSQPSLALTGEEWDRDAWVLGVKNGVIDLRTGDLEPGNPQNFIRKTSPTEYYGLDAPAPLWERFLQEVLAGDDALISFVQRLLGYGLTGLAVEHVLPVLWGTGRNGKGTMLETIGAVLGAELAAPTDANTLMAAGSSNGGLQPFVYDLRGTRLVWASESNEGRRLDAALVKKLTGGDTIKVRTMYSLPVTFQATYLILLLTNHKPHINADDQAIWDRIHLIPFTQRFVDAPQGGNEHLKDKALPKKLQSEAPGILAWLVRGCLDWQRLGGLRPPQSVRLATEKYRTEEDTLGLFIEERLIQKEGASVQARVLYDEYDNWCKDNNLQAMTGTAFGTKIKDKLSHRKSNGLIVYENMGLRFREG